MVKRLLSRTKPLVSKPEYVFLGLIHCVLLGAVEVQHTTCVCNFKAWITMMNQPGSNLVGRLEYDWLA